MESSNIVEKEPKKKSSAKKTVSKKKKATKKVSKYVGSKNGKTFHKKSCSMAKKIERKNRVYFKDTAEAKKLKYI